MPPCQSLRDWYKSDKSNHPNKRSVVFISRPQKLHFTLNHYRYSPNLNLIERLWRFVRKQSLDSTYYEGFEQFTAAIDQCLDGLPTVHKGEMERDIVEFRGWR
jgi:hypothetical protein